MKFLTTAAFAVSTLAGAASAEGLSLQLNWTAGGDHAPLYYALQEGWFADAGVELEIRQGSGSGAAATALDVGQAEVAIIDTPHSAPVSGQRVELHRCDGRLQRQCCGYLLAEIVGDRNRCRPCGAKPRCAGV